jgi:hypothetical protein
MTKQWIVEAKEDPETGDVILPFPEEMIQECGWVNGDEIDFELSDYGVVVINRTKIKRDQEK